MIEYTIEALPFPGLEDVGADPTTISFLVLPALAMLGGLLLPAAIRWLIQRSRVD